MAKESGNVASVVYQTRDYDRFKFSNLNRPVEQARVEFWKRALATNDLLCDNPILVDEDFNVIDGQHRLVAARELGLLVYYRIATKAKVADAPTINSQNKAWTTIDYLTAWCNAGNPHYIRMREVAAMYPWMHLSTLARLMWRKDYAGFATLFQTGGFMVNDEPYVHEVAKCVLDFAAYVPFWRNSTFVTAIANLCNNPAYDHQRMMNKMKMVGNRLVRCATVKDYIDLMSSQIYNYKTKNDALVVLRAINAKHAERGA